MTNPNAPIKSGIAPIRPKPVASPPAPSKAPAPAPPSAKPPKVPPASNRTASPAPPAKAPEPLPSSVELALELTHRTDRQVPGWAFLIDRNSPRKAIVVVLNRSHFLVEKALQTQDPKMLAWLIALPLAETLITRPRIAFVRATQAALRERLLPEAKRHIPGSLFLGQTLSESAPLRALAEKLIASAEAAQPNQRHQVAQVLLTPANE